MKRELIAGLAWAGGTIALALAAAFAAQAAHAETRGEGQWIAAWTASPQPAMPGAAETFKRQTLRLIVHTSIGGSRVRITLSNLHGDTPLAIGGVHIARRAVGADVEAGSARPLTFDGRPSVTVAPGETVTSDPVTLEVAAFSDLAVSLYFPRATPATTTHVLAQQTSYVSAAGDDGGEARFAAGSTTQSWPFLARIEVAASPGSSAVVAIGDSLIDGDGSTMDGNGRWTDALARRLHAAGAKTAVLNQGIIGNRLLEDSPAQTAPDFGEALGEAALRRFDRDVLALEGVRHVVVQIGINDIGFPGVFAPADTAPTAEALIAGFRELADRAHRRGLRIYGSTLSPFEGTTLAEGFHTPAKEAVRQQVNAWLRAGGAFDAIIDFDAVLRDPGHPARLLPRYDSGDHLHPNDAGYAAVADSVPLEWFASGPRQ